MDKIFIFCPACRKRLSLKDSNSLGKRITCPKCTHQFVAERPASATDESPTKQLQDESSEEYADLPPVRTLKTPKRRSRKSGLSKKSVWLAVGRT
jgi:hypothetical protein